MFVFSQIKWSLSLDGKSLTLKKRDEKNNYRVGFFFGLFFLFCKVNMFKAFIQGRGGVAGGPFPADIGRGRGSPSTSHQFIMGLTQRDKQPFTLSFTPTGNLVSPINPTGIFNPKGEPKEPRENPHRHERNMQTPHRKAVPQPGIEPRTFLL